MVNDWIRETQRTEFINEHAQAFVLQHEPDDPHEVHVFLYGGTHMVNKARAVSTGKGPPVWDYKVLGRLVIFNASVGIRQGDRVEFAYTRTPPEYSWCKYAVKH